MARKLQPRSSLQLSPDRRGGANRARAESGDADPRAGVTRAVEMKARLQRTVKGKGSLTLYFTNGQRLQTLYERLVGAQLTRGSGSSASSPIRARRRCWIARTATMSIEDSGS